MTPLYILLIPLLLLSGWFLRNYLRPSESSSHSTQGKASSEWKDAFQTIAAHRGDVAFYLDIESEALTYSADPAVQLLGYTDKQSAAGFDLLKRLVHPSEQNSLMELWERMRGCQDVDTSIRLIQQNGSYCWIQVIAVPAKQKGMTGILRNVQDLHRERDALVEARRMQTITTMAGGLAHEFNNHLTPVTGFIELALDYLGQDHPASEGLNTAMNQALYCSELVSQIQSFGRHQILRKEVIDLDRFLPVAINVAMSGGSVSRHEIEMIRDWESPLPAVFGDPNRLREAFNQLVHNALEAMPGPGTLTVRAGTRAPAHQDPQGVGKEYAFIEVSDTGTGIGPELREQIFDPFFSTRPDRVGRGMGLPMVQGIIAQHDGWLEVQSEVDQGTRVQVFLPRYTAGTAKAADKIDETLSVLPAATAGRMLVADDEVAICRLIERTFEPEGWKIDVLHNYHDVLKKIVREKTVYDLLILDITMPGPSADESLGAIINVHPDAPVLLISGFSRDERIEQLITQSRAEFLGKPFTSHDIISRVDKILSERPGQ